MYVYIDEQAVWYLLCNQTCVYIKLVIMIFIKQNIYRSCSLLRDNCQRNQIISILCFHPSFCIVEYSHDSGRIRQSHLSAIIPFSSKNFPQVMKK